MSGQRSSFRKFVHVLVSLALISNSLFLALQFPLFAPSQTVYAQPGAATVTVQPQNGTIQVSDTFTVTVSIANPTTPLTAFQFDLTYNPNLLGLVDLLPGAFLSSTGRGVTCPQQAYPTWGVVRFACASSGLESAPVGAGLLAEFTFVALYPGTSPLIVSAINLAGPNVPPTSIPATPQSSTVTVTPTPGVVFGNDQTMIGSPGMQVTHVFTLTNLGNYTDTFTLGVAGYTWSTTLPATTIGPLSIGEIAPVEVQVDIPNSLGGTIIATDSFTITATSSHDPNIFALAQGTTLAEVNPGVTLGEDQAGSGAIQTNIHYSLSVTNTGDYTDTFHLTVASDWSTTLSHQETQPLSAGESFPYTLTVTIPQVAIGSQDTATITAISGWNTAIEDELGVTTTAIESEHDTYLPIMVRSGGTSAMPATTPVSVPGLLPTGIELPRGVAYSIPQTQAQTTRLPNCYPPDLDCDLDVDEADLALEAQHWNCSVADPCYSTVYDLDGNNVIDVFDLAWVGNDYDITPPAITIHSPAEGAIVGGSQVIVTGVVSDTHDITAVTINDVVATLIGTAFAATLPVMSGNQVLNITVQDEVGQVSITSRIIGVDADGPMINIHQPDNRQSVYSLTPTVTISYTDFYTGVNVTTLDAWLVDNNGIQTDVTNDLTITPNSAHGTISTALLENTSYTLTVTLADTLGNVSQEEVTFFVPIDADIIIPPIESNDAGWVSGVVYDSSTCDEFLTECQGIAGATVTLTQIDPVALTQVRETRAQQLAALGPQEPMKASDAAAFSTVISGTLITGPGGFFAFPVAETSVYWLRIEKDGFTYAQREAEVVRERSTATNAIYLTPLDSAVTTCGNTGCNHTSSDGTIQIEVPPGAISPGQTEQINATNFEQVEFLPSGELPPGTWETYAFNLGGDSEITFNEPVTIRVANEIGFDPGTAIPLGYWNQVTQQWEHVGTGIVDPTGQWVEMEVTHFSNYDCNDPIAEPDLEVDIGGDASGDNGPGDEEDEPCNGESGCFINYKSGTFEEWIDLPAVTILGDDIAPQLRYSTDRAMPSEVIDIRLGLTEINAAQLGDHIQWELYIEGNLTDSFTFAANLDETGEVGRYRYYWDGRNAQGERLPPGIYEYEVKLSIPYLGQYCYALDGIFGNPPDCENGATGIFVNAVKDVWVHGTVTLLGDVNSPFGTGWTLRGLEQLYENEVGEVLVDEGDSSPVEYYFPGKDLLNSGTVSATGSIENALIDTTGQPFLVTPLLKKSTLKDFLLGKETEVESPIPLSPDPAAKGRVERIAHVPEQFVPTYDGFDLYLLRSGYPVGKTWKHSQFQPGTFPHEAKYAYVLGASQETMPLFTSITSDESMEQTPENESGSEMVFDALVSTTLSTNISGTISTNTTWTASGSPYVIDGNLSIAAGVTLTVEAGVIIKFVESIQLSVQGQLLAQGTAGNEIYFTSIHDDSVGGDTNGNGSATTPARGDWYYIYLSGDGQATLDYAVVHYGGRSGYGNIYTYYYNNNTALIINHSTIAESSSRGLSLNSGGVVTITNSLIHNNNYDGIYGYNTTLTVFDSTIQNNGYDGLWVGGNDFSLNLNNNTISGNDDAGLEIQVANAIITPSISNNNIISNTGDAIFINYSNGAGLPVLSNNTISGNGLNNGIALGGSIGISMTLPADYPLTFVGRGLSVNSNGVLIIEPGAVMKFSTYDSLYVYGTLLAQGTAGNEIYFTSIHDDSVGGDTNGNGSATIPARGDWYYIYLSGDGRTVLDYTVVRYGGRSYSNIYTYYYNNNTTLSINHSTIAESYDKGLFLSNGGIVTITNSLIQDNNGEGVYASDVALNLSGSTIQNNGYDGIRVAGNNASIHLSNNTISGNGDTGLEIQPSGGIISPTISNNSIINNMGDAIFVNYSNGAGLPILSNNTISGNGLTNGIALGGSIGFSMTLPASYPLTFVSRWLSVNDNVTLTVEPGVVMKFGSYDSLNVYGTLSAQGITGNEIYFTSIHDDSVGGDTNGDGSATSPARGDWYYIYLSGDGQVVLDYAVVRYGGRYGYGNIYTYYYSNNTILTINNSIIAESSSRGLYLSSGGVVTITNSFLQNNSYDGIYGYDVILTVSGSTIQNNGYDGILIGGNNFSLDLNNNIISGNGDAGLELQPSNAIITPTISNNSIISNTGDAIFVNYNNGAGLPLLSNNTISGNGLNNGIALGGSIGVSMTLPSDYPLTFVSRGLSVNENVILILAPGVVVKFDTYDSLYVYGTLSAQGTAGNEIYFTSIHDDSVGGDTNGNGSATSPARGNWAYIYLSGDGQATLDYAVVRYGGRYGYGNIYTYYYGNNTSLIINHSTIAEGFSRGLYLSNGGVVTITNSVIQNNNYDGIYGYNVILSVSGSTIQYNGYDGIQVGGNNLSLDLNNNSISGNGDTGLEIQPTNAAITPTISNNSIISNTGDAIFVNYYNGAGLPILNNNTISNNGLNNGIALGGSIGISMTLPASYPLTYVGRNLSVSSNTALIIESGTVVKFSSYDSLTVNGTLLAQGASGNEIYFTSIHDDSVGGDTNGNGSVTAPARGDWYYISLSGDGQATFDYAVVRYGGRSGYGNIYAYYYNNNTTLTINHSTIVESSSRGLYLSSGGIVTVTNSLIENNNSDGIYGHNVALLVSGNIIQNNGNDGVWMGGDSFSLNLNNNIMSGNGDTGLEIQPASVLISSTISNNTIISNTGDAIFVNYNNGAGLPVLSNNTISGNGLHNGIALGGSLGISMTLPASYPLTFVSRGLSVNNNVTLTFEAGAVLKFSSYDGLSIYGTLLAQGTANNEIYFTSIHDDSVGGDTNGNGSATSPARGDWPYIYLSGDGQATLNYAVVRYGGRYGYGNIYSYYYNNTALTINHSTIAESSGRGLYLSNGGVVTVTNSLIHNNNYDGIYGYNTILTVSGSTLQNNGYDGVQSTGSNAGLTLSNSTINDNDQDGVEAGNLVNISGNIINHNGETGIQLLSTNGVITPAITNNTIISNTGDAIFVNYNNGAGLPILSNNIISGNRLNNGIALGGNLGINMTLPVGYPLTFVSRGLSVNENVSLTLEPGVVMKFSTNDALYVYGTLLAQGATDNEIYFTSIHDDSVGGDTNGNGSATTPAKGDWYYIFLSGNGQASLDYAVVRYGGRGGYGNIYTYYYNNNTVTTINNSVIAESGSRGFYLGNGGIVTVTNSLITNNYSDGVYIYNTTVSLFGNIVQNNGTNGINASEATLTVSSNTIQNNGATGIQLENTLPLLNNNILQNNTYPVRITPNNPIPDLMGNTVQGNSVDAIAVSGGTLTISRTWQVEPVPYLMLSGFTVVAGTIFTISPGVEILFANSSGLYVEGTLHAAGNTNQPIHFSSVATTPAPNDWYGIFLGPDSDDSVLAYCEVDYAGRNRFWYSRTWYSNLAFYQSDAQVVACEVHHSYRNGVESFDSAPQLIEADIHDNLYRGLYVLGNNATPSINQSAIYSNTLYGIENSSSQLMEARYNWWGDPTGPYHPSANPGGLGDRVSNNVNFDPWLTEPVFDLAIGLNKTETDFTTLIYNVTTNSYTRHYLDGTVIRFNGVGQHEATVSPDGRTTVFTYHPDGQLATMAIVPPGEINPRWIWTFNYIAGKLSSIEDPAGRITIVTIDAQGNLVAATTPDNATQTFTYDANHLLTHYSDQNGNVTSQTYDEYGRIATLTEPPRAVYDPDTGQVNVVQEVRTFTPSDTGYPLINESVVGNPNNPAPAVPTSSVLRDRVVYGRGERSGYTNRWGSWLQETDGEGRTTFYERDAANHATRIDYADGDCVEYVYDISTGLLLSEQRMGASQCALPFDARDPSQIQIWSYTYKSEFNQVKTETDPLGNTTTYIYDYEESVGSAGRLIRVEYPPVPDEFGVMVTPTTSYTYNNWGLKETVTDARGTITRYVYTQGTPDEAYGQPNAVFAPGVTPVPGLLTQIIEDFGGINLTTIRRDFDGAGNPETTLGPDGHLTTLYTYDGMNRMLSQTDAVGIDTNYTYDGRGNLIRQVVDYTADGVSGRNVVTEYTYNASGQVLTERTTDSGLTVQTSTVYDINRQVALTQDGRGNTTIYRYDDANQLIHVIDPAGKIITYTYALDGQLETFTNADGFITRYTYDGYGRLTVMTEDEGGLNLTTRYAYDLNDNLLMITDTVSTVTCYTYDSHNRQTEETQDCGGLDLVATYTYDVNDNTRYLTDRRGIVTAYQYDALDRPTQMRLDDGDLNLTTGYTYDTAGNLYRQTDERGVITEYLYDDLNRMTSSCRDRLGLNLCTVYGYDRLNNQTTVTDPNSVTTRTDYNGFRLPTRVIEDTGNLNATTSYFYDNALNLVRLVDANLNSTQYTYDARNLLASEQYADSTTIGYTYDDRGNLSIRTDQDDNTTTHSYDGVGRLTEKAFSTGGWQRYGYDDAGRMLRAEEQMNGHHSLLTFGYNTLGDVISTTQSLDSYTWPVAYGYDYVSGVYTVTYPSGAERVHTLDPIGRLDAVHQGNGNLVADYEYHDLNSFTTVAYPNGLITRTDYDALYRTTRVSSAVADYRYGYDNAGNRTYMQRWHETNHPADVYEYDNLYQLTQVWYDANATEPGNITSYEKLQWYDLDNLGNRLEVQNNGTSTHYQPSNGQQLMNPMNRYEQVDGTPFTYDLRGNTLNDQTNAYTYDILNQQTGMSGPGGNAQYIYDALGRRIAKIVDGVTVYHIYDTHYRVIEERTGDNSVTARYAYSMGIDESLTMERGGITYYYHHDALGSVTEVTNASGLLVEHYEYDIYGKPSIFDSTGMPIAISAVGNAYLFTSQQYDIESWNYYFRARVYAPGMGRFLQTDPLGFVDGMGLYVYVRNNPVDHTDPIGLRTRRRWRDPNFWRGWNLSIFDERGKELLGRWLDGSGDTLRVEDGNWGRYMKANSLLSSQLTRALERDAQGRSNTGRVNIRFHAVIQDGYITGYQMLHGTNADVGDFQIQGLASVSSTPEGRRIIEYDLKYTWNDKIDPEKSISSDVFFAEVLELFYDPEDYDAHISWNADSLIRKCGDTIEVKNGYPFD